MVSALLFVLSINIIYSRCNSEVFVVEKDDLDDNTDSNRFSEHFLFGASTAAYQIEGGWNADGKGPSIWDTLTHKHPELIADRSNGDVGADSYHLFDEDLAIIKELGLNVYRFSISWSRVLPTGDVSSLNQAGIDYYNNIIDKLTQNGIEPMVTMYHYDLPEELVKLGGLANPLFVQYFKEYANLLFSYFGDRVKWWITFNEPYDYCVAGYGTGKTAPLINASGVGEYLCVDHTIKAHAVTYRLYREQFYNSFQGKIGITLSSIFCFSKDNDDVLADRGMQFRLGWLAHPIFSKDGGYPQIMVEEINNSSISEGRKWSRLPAMNDHWKNIIKGAADFIGLNYYTSRYIQTADPPQGENPSYERDSKVKFFHDPSWRRSKSFWLYSVPEGLRGILGWIKNEYDNTEVFITENGWSDDGQLDDTDRIQYIKDHLREILKAINEDGCNVSGYTAWSLIDNFEWLRGYTEHFGLYAVNLTSPNKDRTAKSSAHFYKEIIKTRTLPN